MFLQSMFGREVPSKKKYAKKISLQNKKVENASVGTLFVRDFFLIFFGRDPSSMIFWLECFQDFFGRDFLFRDFSIEILQRFFCICPKIL